MKNLTNNPGKNNPKTIKTLQSKMSNMHQKHTFATTARVALGLSGTTAGTAETWAPLSSVRGRLLTEIRNLWTTVKPPKQLFHQKTGKKHQKACPPRHWAALAGGPGSISITTMASWAPFASVWVRPLAKV